MFSQRRLLLWTQYKSELTICNNFNRTTVTVNIYIKVIGITKIQIVKNSFSVGTVLRDVAASWMMQETSNITFNFKQIQKINFSVKHNYYTCITFTSDTTTQKKFQQFNTRYLAQKTYMHVCIYECIKESSLIYGVSIWPQIQKFVVTEFL